MIKKVGDSLPFKVQYIAGRVGKTGLTVTFAIYLNGNSTPIDTGNANEVGGGIYRHVMSGSLNTVVGDYICVFSTTDTTVDQRDIASDWEVVDWITFVDIATSSRAPASTALSNTIWTDPRAALLDNLSRLDASIVAAANAILAALAAGVTLVDGAITAAKLGAHALAAQIPDIWSDTYAPSRTLTSGGGITAADVWTYANRLLTSPQSDQLAHLDMDVSTLLNAIATAVNAISPTIQRNSIRLERGDSWSQIPLTVTPFTWNAGDILDLMVKDPNDYPETADTTAILWIRLTNGGAITDGLQRLNGSYDAADLAKASLAVLDNNGGQITFTVLPSITKQFSPRAFVFDLQRTTFASGDVQTVGKGTLSIDADVNRGT